MDDARGSLVLGQQAEGICVKCWSTNPHPPDNAAPRVPEGREPTAACPVAGCVMACPLLPLLPLLPTASASPGPCSRAWERLADWAQRLISHPPTHPGLRRSREGDFHFHAADGAMCGQSVVSQPALGELSAPLEPLQPLAEASGA